MKALVNRRASCKTTEVEDNDREKKRQNNAHVHLKSQLKVIIVMY